MNAKACEWAKRNRERRLVTAKAWRDKNLSHAREYAQKWTRKNPEKTRAYLTKYRRSRSPEAKARAAAATKRRYERDKRNITKWIGEMLRRRLVHALHGRVKHARAFELLGCSVSDFRMYLESKFEPGMDWSNYGRSQTEKRWEIDHIMPCAIFDLSKPEHQKRCFHFSNLQPLWASDNRAKRDKVLTPQMPLI